MRCEPDVSHDGNACLDHGPHSVRVVGGSLNLDRVRQSFFQEPYSGGHCLPGGNLVAAERQVRHDQRTLRRPAHGTCEGKELVHGDGKARLVAVHVVGSRVAHQEDFDSRLVKDFSGVLLICRQHGEVFAVVLGLLQVVNPDPADRLPAGC
ncbi:hypothetical protein D3C73_1297670 [compost metagenome]